MEKIARSLGRRMDIKGIVQGVGFRPFVYALATKYSLKGWIRNTSAGVELEIDGEHSDVTAFIEDLHNHPPPLARIDRIIIEEIPPNHFPDFQIQPSIGQEGGFQPISPDVSICEDCLRELYDPSDRRYAYPFINCTNCGPRFTIIKEIPYDRPFTTMAHAQPIACPECGPHISLEIADEEVATGTQALSRVRDLIAKGEIVAIKGLGGFHIACDATRRDLVNSLRKRKGRVDKPFAIMFADMEAVERECLVKPFERDLLQSRERPIVILERKPDSTVCDEVSPGTRFLGVMLPYTPLHSLLLQPAPEFPDALIMTSGNRTDEPIITSNVEARQELSGVVTAFLMHDREIGVRCDDSVTRVFQSARYPIRRSRGYAPDPIHLHREGAPLLAVGAELKNTFCLTREKYAFQSQHIGDLKSAETFKTFENNITHFEQLFRFQPEVLAYDLHPNYLSTRYALERGQREEIPTIGVQHHHAHIAACMADAGYAREEPVIGVVFDGAGFGDDGAIWGGEFLIADFISYQRASHLAYIPLPGGDKAVQEAWRLGLVWLVRCGEMDLAPLKFEGVKPYHIETVVKQIDRGINCPLTSSMGRLFDSVASIVGLRNHIHYEGQAAIELEALVDPDERGVYDFGGSSEIDPNPVIHSILEDMQKCVSVPRIAAKFHNAVVQLVLDRCIDLRKTFGVEVVALSGGVWQNMILLDRTYRALQNAGFEVLCHRIVPANDGGLSLGQAMVAQRRFERSVSGMEVSQN
jgi:hydrogenase maturation protein HypF